MMDVLLKMASGFVDGCQGILKVVAGLRCTLLTEQSQFDCLSHRVQDGVVRTHTHTHTHSAKTNRLATGYSVLSVKDVPSGTGSQAL